MNDLQPIQGDLQSRVMAVMWRLETATVEQVRSALPPRYRGAYTTIQTVLNRLAERGLLTRHKHRNAIEYRPAISEACSCSRSSCMRSAGSSPAAARRFGSCHSISSGTPTAGLWHDATTGRRWRG